MNNFEFAIKMEFDGEKYYKEQAELNKDNALSSIFQFLAKDEEHHAKTLQNKMNELAYELKDNETLIKYRNVFSGIEDLKREMKKNAIQLDSYKMAVEMEKRSIDLYERLLSEATDNKSKELFEFLVEQEEHHLEILEELVILISRPEEWVESAEFGNRKDY